MAERWTPVDGAKSDPSVVGVSTCSNVIQGVIDELHQRYSPLLDGAPADYIPELAKADPSDFGIVIATVVVIVVIVMVIVVHCCRFYFCF